MIGPFEMAPMALIPPKLALGVPGSALTMFPANACPRIVLTPSGTRSG